MKRVQVALCFVFLFFLTTSHAVDLKQSAQSFKEFDYNKATDFSQVGDMVRDDMSGQHFGLSRSISNTADKFLNDYAKSNPRDFSAIANLDKAREYNDKQNAALKEHLKSEVSKDYSQRMENYLRDHLLKEASPNANAGASGKDLSQIEQMIANVKSQAEAKAKAAVEKMLPSQEKILAERIKAGSSSLDSPFKNFAESLSSSLMNQTGDITKDGLKEFADNQMKDAFGVDKVTDIAGYVNDKVHSAGDLLDKAGDELGINDLKDKLSTGELQNQIQKILDKSGLPNPFNLNAGDYISSAKDALNNAAGLDIPMLELPSNAYSVIQIASGVSHFMRAIGFLYIDPTEIKKGRNCLDVAHWALSDKDRAFRIMGGRLGLMDALEIANKYSGASAALAGAAGIDPATLNKLKGAIDKVQNFDLKDLAATKLGLGDVIDELGDVKSKIDEGIANAKGAVTDKLGDLADKTGVSDAIDKVKETKDKVKEKINETKEDLKEKAKDMLPENGKYFVDAKPTMESPKSDKNSDIDPIILYSGEFVTESTDLKVRSVGIDFEFKRYYRSQRERDSLIGYNWSFNFDQKIIRTGDDFLYQDETGQIYGFKMKDDGTFETPYQLTSTLFKIETGYKLTERDGTTKQFDNDGLLIKISDRHNNLMTFEYAGTKEIKYLKYIVDTQGRRYTLRYEDGKLSSLTDPFEREVKYTHDKHDNLASVRTPITSDYPQGKITRYNYSGGNIEERLNHNLTMIMDPKGQVYLKNTYGEEGTVKDRLVAQQYGGEKAPMMTVQYEIVNPRAPDALVPATALGTRGARKNMNEVATKTITTDRLGKKEIYEHNAFGLRLSADGFAYTYDDKGRLVHECRGELPFARINGKCTIYTYDNDTIKQKTVIGSDGTVVETHYAYGPFNQLKEKTVMSSYKCDVGLTNCTTGPLQQRTVAYEFDSKGNIAKKIDGDEIKQYEYNELGQVVKETKNSGLYTSYFYDGALVTKITEIPPAPRVPNAVAGTRASGRMPPTRSFLKRDSNMMCMTIWLQAV